MIDSRSHGSYLIGIMLFFYYMNTIIFDVPDCHLSANWTCHKLINSPSTSKRLLDEFECSSELISFRTHFHVIVQAESRSTKILLI